MPVAAAIGLGAVGSVAAAAIGANAQTNAANKAIAAQQAALQQGYSFANTQAGNAANALSAFTSGGQQAFGTYLGDLGQLTGKFDASQLAQTPGYQFALQQGLKGVQNSYAAQGLGSSGSALKGAAQFATGTAQNTYNQQFQNYLAQNQQIANILLGGAGIGAGAAGQLAGIYGQLGAAGLGAAVGTGQGVANSLTGAGNAIAGAATGAANSLQGGINTGLQYSLLSQLLGNQQQAGINNIAYAYDSQYGTNALMTSLNSGMAFGGQ